MVRYLFYTVGDLTNQSPLVILLDLIARAILGEQYRSLSSSLCSFPTLLLPRPSFVGISTLYPVFSNLSGLQASVPDCMHGCDILVYGRLKTIRKRTDWQSDRAERECRKQREEKWRHCPTSRKVAGSIPDDVTGILHSHNPSGRTVALGSTQPLSPLG